MALQRRHNELGGVLYITGVSIVCLTIVQAKMKESIKAKAHNKKSTLNKTLQCKTKRKSYQQFMVQNCRRLLRDWPGQGLYSLSGRTSYREISWSLEAARLDVRIIITLNFDRHLGSSAAEMPIKFQGDSKSITPNLAARDLTKFYGKISMCLVNRGHGTDILPKLNNTIKQKTVEMMLSYQQRCSWWRHGT